MEEYVKDLEEPSVVDANRMVCDMILRKKIQEATARVADQCSTKLKDMQLETQPADVFQRMWTLVGNNNPIWKVYCALINNHTRSSGKGNRQASACENCMTIFYPYFPDDFHLHRKSEGFKKAINARVVKSNTLAVSMTSDKEKQLRKGTAYKALIPLAKEANAYKSQLDSDGFTREYIKMVRFVKGVRMVAGGVKYPRVDLCEMCEVEGDIQRAAEQNYNVKVLADGISQLIWR
jgi:uncharacterized OB-fold protein